MFKSIKKLKEIKSPSDIKYLKVLSTYDDDHLQCADVEINGIKLSFMWHDNLGFLKYWDESKKAFNDLLSAIEGAINCQDEEDEEDDGAPGITLTLIKADKLID